MRSVLTIGLFDGVHIGHRRLLERVVNEARERGAEPVAVTFDLHPAYALNPDAAPLMLTTKSDKVALLKRMGIERVIVLPFTPGFADLKPEEFLHEYISREEPALIIVGEDFRFGRRGSGDGALLKRFAESIGASAEIFPLVIVNGSKASSSNARERIERGDIKGAFEILGRFPSYTGTVTKGTGRGRQIGFPTVNISPDHHMCLPMNGVYAGAAYLSGGPEIAVIDVGVAPTFHDRTAPRIEAHIIDFAGDLYGLEIRIEFREFLRREQRFAGPDELARQISLDASQARGMVSLTDIERRNESKDGTD